LVLVPPAACCVITCPKASAVAVRSSQ